MDDGPDPLMIDPEEISQQIQTFIQDTLRQLSKAGILISLSGGLDSSIVAYLSVRAVGPEKVHLINLVEQDSKRLHRRHAYLVAERLGISLDTRDLTRLLSVMGTYNLLPIGALPLRKLREYVVKFGRKVLGLNRSEGLLERRFQPGPNTLPARGRAYAMTKHRLRMVITYQLAEVQDWMVVGAANRTEYLTGTFSQWGVDHCADLMPILHLYRSQLPSLAAFLGVPKAIRSKPADPDLLPGVEDKGTLLGSFQTTDRILWGFEHGVGREDLIGRYGEGPVRRVEGLVELSRPMRDSPYSLLESPSSGGPTG